MATSDLYTLRQNPHVRYDLQPEPDLAGYKSFRGGLFITYHNPFFKFYYSMGTWERVDSRWIALYGVLDVFLFGYITK